MAGAFPLRSAEAEKAVTFTDSAIANRRASFDSSHYSTYWKKVHGLCDLLLKKQGGKYLEVNAVFNYARADEIVHGLFRVEEWLKGHVANEETQEKDHAELLKKITTAREHLVTRYTEAATGQYYPADAVPDVYTNPQIVVVLGCKDNVAMNDRIAAAIDVIRDMRSDCPVPALVLSGGGFGQEKSEAERMLEELRCKYFEKDSSSSLSKHGEKPNWWVLKTLGRTFEVALEQDSLDTLGNAIFSWLTLKLDGEKFGLRSTSRNRLERLVVVTDGIHAPRSYDIFRRVFAFRPGALGVEHAPRIVVRTAASPVLTSEEKKVALDHLRSESLTNAEIFRLVNPLTNGFDVIENGHVRSVLGQMLRLHKLYHGRWDLVRKYHNCWKDNI